MWMSDTPEERQTRAISAFRLQDIPRRGESCTLRGRHERDGRTLAIIHQRQAGARERGKGPAHGESWFSGMNHDHCERKLE